MNRKVATLTLGLAATGLISAPMAAAAPGDTTNNVNTAIGQAISGIAKNGGGASGVLNQLSTLKPSNTGLATAVQNAAKNLPTTVAVPSATDISAARATVGKSIADIAKNGGGASGILTQLQQLKPDNTGIANALSKLVPAVPTTPAA